LIENCVFFHRLNLANTIYSDASQLPQSAALQR